MTMTKNATVTKKSSAAPMHHPMAGLLSSQYIHILGCCAQKACLPHFRPLCVLMSKIWSSTWKKWPYRIVGQNGQELYSALFIHSHHDSSLVEHIIGLNHRNKGDYHYLYIDWIALFEYSTCMAWFGGKGINFRPVFFFSHMAFTIFCASRTPSPPRGPHCPSQPS